MKKLPTTQVFHIDVALVEGYYRGDNGTVWKLTKVEDTESTTLFEKKEKERNEKKSEKQI